MTDYRQLKLKIRSLTVFAGLKRDPLVASLLELLDTVSAKPIDTDRAVEAYSRFAETLFGKTDDLSEYVRETVLKDENFYIKKVAAGEEPGKELNETVKNELAILSEIAALSSKKLAKEIDEVTLPGWKNGSLKLTEEFSTKLANISSTGYGIYAEYTFFRVDEGKIVPVAYPDYQPLDMLFEYERERNIIIRNTEALVNGEKAVNMLLYGDMGTGKSSTIKAVAAAYSDRGLRIVEVKKNQLFMIPEIMEELASNPLKFILFIDDLSFSGNDDNFSALKATLEGSISGCGDNTVIYATSNRRHLVKENFSDRDGDELHVNDTLQETMSLASRFGLTITFQKPGKDDYLSIVRSLAEEYGIAGDYSEEELYRRAEAFAIRKNGRSPRTARQFVELLKIGI
ncbi:MAG: ATP-binding protein [Firmicutes bacterium]|nr:ATP-binding protein [Bacillota bacterium]